MSTLNIKTGDLVKIIAGEDKNKTGKVIKTYPTENKIVVEDVNVVVKHRKARSAQDTGGIVKQPAKIDASNAVIVCPECGANTKVAAGCDEKGKKFRACKKCGASLEVKRAATKAKRATAKRKTTKKADAATAEEAAE